MAPAISLPSTPWIPVLNDVQLESCPFLDELDDMFPSASSPLEEDRAWSLTMLRPFLEVAGERRSELWEAVVWLWRLKEIEGQSQGGRLWNNLVQVWMVRLFSVFGLDSFLMEE